VLENFFEMWVLIDTVAHTASWSTVLKIKIASLVGQIKKQIRPLHVSKRSHELVVIAHDNSTSSSLLLAGTNLDTKALTKLQLGMAQIFLFYLGLPNLQAWAWA
jgi:hypothetical protein